MAGLLQALGVAALHEPAGVVQVAVEDGVGVRGFVEVDMPGCMVLHLPVWAGRIGLVPRFPSERSAALSEERWEPE